MEALLAQGCGPAVIHDFMVLAALLFVKHLLADGPLQTRYQLANKGRLLHPGGLLHAGIHAGFTGICLLVWLWMTPLTLDWATASGFGGLLVVEFVVHYAADFTKVRLDRKFAWSSVEVGEGGDAALRITSSFYFFSFLADQTIHSLTYLWIIYAVSDLVLGPAEFASLCAGAF